MGTAEIESDASLWARAAETPTPFGVLYERHADAVYNHCFRQTGSWSAAEDLTSAVFLDAWRRRREVKLVSDSILPWLLAVANNAVRNSRRSWRREALLLRSLPSEPITPDHAEDAGDRVDSERHMQQVLAAFSRLSAAEQDVLSLCGWAGVEYEAAAQVLRVPVGTVRSRLSRAREKLQRLSLTSDASDRAADHRSSSTHPLNLGADHV
jgi:RNA polymerase sigma factor (sigma-70 family)